MARSAVPGPVRGFFVSGRSAQSLAARFKNARGETFEMPRPHHPIPGTAQTRAVSGFPRIPRAAGDAQRFK
jgi:hypothetical protein